MKDTEESRCPVTGQRGPVPVDPGPKGLPIVGITFDWVKDPFTTGLRVQRDHGELAMLRMFRNPACQVTSVDAVRRVLVANAGNYRRGRLHRGLRQWMGEGLITLDGDAWREHRTVAQPAFNADQTPAQHDAILYAIRALHQRWDALADSGESVGLRDEMNVVVSRAFGKALLDKDLDEDVVRAVEIAGKAIYRASAGTEVLPSFLPTKYNRQKRWAQRVLDRVAAEVIAARSATDDRVDVAGQFLRSDLPRKAFRDNLRTIFLAGADTTAAALAWALWELARHPQAREEVEAEADRVLGEREPTEQDIARLPVCRAIADETMRLHPPIWLLSRSANDTDVVDQRSINKDDALLISFYAMHRSPKYWDDPDSFDHRRFLGERGKEARRCGAYLPFGSGKHQCIGKDLALNTLVIALAMLSRRYRVAIDGTEPVHHAARVTLQPQQPIRCTVRRR